MITIFFFFLYLKNIIKLNHIIFVFIYLLKNNKKLITGKNNKILKEIKITDYKNTDMAIYKGIFYIYDNGKIYEYLLKNLNEVKRYDIN